MIPEEEHDILDGMTDDEGGDGGDGDGPGGDGARTKKSIDAPSRPEAPTELPDDPGGGTTKEKEKKSKSTGSSGDGYHIDEAVRELSEDHLYGSKPSASDEKPPGPSGRTRPRASEEAPDSVMEELRRIGLVKGDALHWSRGAASDGKVYLTDDGEPCKIDKRGAAYRIGPDGRRSIPTLRPKDKFAPEEWKALGSKGRKIELDIIREEEKKRKAKESSIVHDDAKLDSKAKKKAKKEAKKAEKKIKKALWKIRKDEGEHDPALPVIIPADIRVSAHTDGGAAGWEWAEDYCDMVYSQAFYEDCFAMAADTDLEGIEHKLPRMPCLSAGDAGHREKVKRNAFHFFNAMVTRPVNRKELLSNPKAMEAFLKEWKGLWDQGVFDFSVVREYDDVIAEAKAKKQQVHMARVHGLIYEKNFQLKEGDPARKYKGRGVLLGGQVKDQNMEAALFQDLGNSPANFDSARWADFYGCLPGNDVQMADAIQAYIQAVLTGVPCWVELPKEAWHPSVDIGKYRRPVCRLVKALYGHPDAGTMWEQRCHNAVQKVGFKPVGDEWPSLYFHAQLKLLLVVYVDDLKLAGPSQNLKRGWELLGSELRLEPPTPLGLYLGCNITKGESELHDKTKVRTVTYDMESYLEMTVKKYTDVTGVTRISCGRWLLLVCLRRRNIILRGRPLRGVLHIGVLGADTPCLLTRMVGLFRLLLFLRRPRKRRSQTQIAGRKLLTPRAY